MLEVYSAKECPFKDIFGSQEGQDGIFQINEYRGF